MCPLWIGAEFEGRLAQRLAFLLTILWSVPALSAKPILARLSFSVPQERMAAFEVDYSQKVVPFLKSRGMVPHSDLGRPTAKGVFARLIVFPSVKAFIERRDLLLSDPEWEALIVALGLDKTDPTQNDAWFWGIYSAPVGQGRKMVADLPTGRWRIYDADMGSRLTV